MRSSILGLLLSCVAAIALGQDPVRPLSPQEAAKMANQDVTVEMRVNSTGGMRNSYLNSARDFSQANNFAIFIPELARKKFADRGIERPDEHYYGKTIRVTGTVTLSRDRPRIIVSDPSQLTILESKSDSPVRKRTHVYKQAGGVDIRADSYNFIDRSGQPVVVWIHGGALMNGHRESFPEWLANFAREKGCVLVSIDYRLAPETKLPEIIADLEDAFRWIHNQGRRLFQADPDRMAAIGGSAGGYLALTAGYRVEPRLTAVVSLWGYGDLIGPWYSEPSTHARHQQIKMSADEAWAQVSGEPVSDSRERRGNGSAFYQFCRQQGLWPKAVTGWDPRSEAEKFAPYMPLRNVTRGYPTTLLVHGDRDTDVPYEQSKLMHEELRRNGVVSDLVTVKGGEHGLAGVEAEVVASTYKQAADFLNRQLTRREP